MQRPRGTPLAALFLLLAAVGIFMSLISEPLREGALLKGDDGAIAMPGGLIGFVAGIVLGSVQPRPVRMSMLGAAVGTLCGIFAGLIFLAPPHPAGVALACAILLATGVLLRTTSRQRRS